MFWGGERIRSFAAAILPAQVVAASTQSSLASLPAMLEIAQRRLGYSPQITALVLPMAVSLFRINSPVQYVSAAAFLGHRILRHGQPEQAHGRLPRYVRPLEQHRA